MSNARLSALDASFLDVEGPSAHMHVGWTATFSPPKDSEPPSFEALRAHIAGRLGRAPRYRQKLASVPFDVHAPVWIDDEKFDPERHILPAPSSNLDQEVERVMSTPLKRDRPLWEIWILDHLDGGGVGMVGKAHHCMVDGIAAVELASLLLDPEPAPESAEADGWEPEPTPAAWELLAGGVVDRLREGVQLSALPLHAARHPRRLLGVPSAAVSFGRTLARAGLPMAPKSSLNGSGSPQRHLARSSRPLEDLRSIKRRFHVTVNDVLLAACAGGVRGLAAGRGEEPVDLKTMVPVNVRGDGAGDDLGNQISFTFVSLPCSEADPLERLMRVHHEVGKRRGDEDPEEADATLKAVNYAPRALQRAVSRAFASPRMFNLVVSNIPGPPVPLWMLGCRLEETSPIVPLAADHAVSIGMTTVRDRACFGIYADRETLPDADLLAEHVDAAVDELLELSA